MNDINQCFELQLWDEDTLKSDDLLGVIEPKKLAELLEVTEQRCQSEAFYKSGIELPL